MTLSIQNYVDNIFYLAYYTDTDAITSTSCCYGCDSPVVIKAGEPNQQVTTTINPNSGIQSMVLSASTPPTKTTINHISNIVRCSSATGLPAPNADINSPNFPITADINVNFQNPSATEIIFMISSNS